MKPLHSARRLAATVVLCTGLGITGGAWQVAEAATAAEFVQMNAAGKKGANSYYASSGSSNISPSSSVSVGGDSILDSGDTNGWVLKISADFDCNEVAGIMHNYHREVTGSTAGIFNVMRSKSLDCFIKVSANQSFLAQTITDIDGAIELVDPDEAFSVQGFVVDDDEDGDQDYLDDLYSSEFDDEEDGGGLQWHWHEGRRLRKNLRSALSAEEEESGGTMGTQDSPRSWGLDRIDQGSLPLDGTTFQSSYTGKGYTIYLIDTGVYTENVDFGSRASFGVNFVLDEPDTDRNGHGSHCAGTAIGGTLGVARGAEVVAVKVLSASGTGSTSDVIKGIQWAADDAGDQTAVFSISIGGGFSTVMNAAVKAASDQGHIVVVAAGNEATSACNKSPAAAGGTAYADHGVITVAASTKRDGFASYSNYGSCVDIIAPGSSILSASNSNTGVRTMSGTSMATPHVAGVAATLLEKHKGNKDRAMDELFAIFAADQITGTPSDTPNALLQTDRYTGPPTPPTRKPTRAPTFAPARLCAMKTGSKEEYCATEVMLSRFSPDIEDLTYIQGAAAFAGDLCSIPSKGAPDYTGAAVVVTRGDCIFFTKVENAAKLGAKFVVIQASEGDEIFEPTYYGNHDPPAIYSGMVEYGVVQGWINGKMDSIFWGNPDIPTPRPTCAPTDPPCSELTKRKDCRKRKADCKWKKKTCQAKS